MSSSSAATKSVTCQLKSAILRHNALQVVCDDDETDKSSNDAHSKTTNLATYNIYHFRPDRKSKNADHDLSSTSASSPSTCSEGAAKAYLQTDYDILNENDANAATAGDDFDKIFKNYTCNNEPDDNGDYCKNKAIVIGSDQRKTYLNVNMIYFFFLLKIFSIELNNSNIYLIYFIY